MIQVLPLILTCVTLVTIGQLCLRVGARRGSSEHKSGLFGFLESVSHPVVWVGVAAFGLHFCVWMLVLNKIALNVAYPLMSLDYVVVTLCSAVLLGERVQRRRWVGVAFIVAGVILIGVEKPVAHPQPVEQTSAAETMRQLTGGRDDRPPGDAPGRGLQLAPRANAMLRAGD